MNRYILCVLLVIAFVPASGQCKDIKYSVPKSKYYSLKDSIVFFAKNYCDKHKEILFSLEYKTSTYWQEVDGDIFVKYDNGMKIINLPSMVRKSFNYKIQSVDSVFDKPNDKVNFRIVANLYSADGVQIIQTKVIKEFWVVYKE